MIINFPIIEEGIRIEENMATILVVEDQNLFYKIVTDIKDNVSGEKNEIGLYQNHKELKFKSEVDIISSVFDFSVNSKKFISKLHQSISEKAKSEGNYLKWQNVIFQIEKYLQDMLFEVDDELTYDSIDTIDIIKMFGVKYATYDNVQEKVIQYIEVCSRCTTIKVLVLVNVKTVLNENQLEDIYKVANYQKIRLLLLENTERTKMQNEREYILDKDLFLIYK